MDFQCTSILVAELAAIHYPSALVKSWNDHETEFWMLLKWLLSEKLWELLFLPTCDVWTFMDVTHNYVRILRGLVKCHFLWVNCADVWHCSGSTAWGWRWIIRKFSICSAIIGLLAAIPANIAVFTNFILPFISSQSCRILLFLPFCWFCALFSISGLWAVFLCWIAGKLKKLIRSHESEPTNKILSFVVIPRFGLSYL